MSIPLDNPRGIALGEDGSAYVADSGDPATAFPGRVVQVTPAGNVESHPPRFSAFSGDSSGEAYVFGISDVAMVSDNLHVLMGFGTFLESPIYAENRLIAFAPDGSVRELFDVGGYERDNDPDGAGADSNATSLAVAEAGVVWVTDAAGNWAARLVPADAGDGQLEVSAVAAFPAVDGEDAVPTGIAVGPDGNAYVALFRCQQPTAGKGGVARVRPDGSYDIVATGLSNPIDVAFDAAGRMYVLEFAVDYAPETGRLLVVDENGEAQVMLAGLPFPTSLAISDEGDVYITEISSPAGGPAGSGRLRVYESLVAGPTE